MNMKQQYFQQAIIRNIGRQKTKINNDKNYTQSEKDFIIKGLNMAIDRVNTAYQDVKYRDQVGLPQITKLNIR